MPVPVVVRGRPYAADQAAVDRMVADVITRAVSWEARPRFTTEPSAAAPSDLRIVVSFNPSPGAGGAGNCDGTVAGGTEDEHGQVRVLATFCAGSRVLANVEGRIGGVGDDSDARVQALIRQITIDMFQAPNQP